MNARLLTIVFLLCSLGIAKFIMAPKLTELTREQTRASKMEKDIMLAQLDQQFVAALPERPPVGESMDGVTVQALSRLHHTYPDFGIAISDVTPGSSVGGQNVIPLQDLQGHNNKALLKFQEMSIKGSYESLEEFQGFIHTQIMDLGGSVSSLKLKGNAFEMKVQWFGIPQKAGS